VHGRKLYTLLYHLGSWPMGRYGGTVARCSLGLQKNRDVHLCGNQRGNGHVKTTLKNHGVLGVFVVVDTIPLCIPALQHQARTCIRIPNSPYHFYIVHTVPNRVLTLHYPDAPSLHTFATWLNALASPGEAGAPHPHTSGVPPAPVRAAPRPSPNTSHARLTPTRTHLPLRERRTPHRSNSATLTHAPVIAAPYGRRLARALRELLVAPWAAHAVAETALGGAGARGEERVREPRREAVGVAAVAADGAPGPEGGFVGNPRGGLGC
jgi:hypothetical protein